MWLATTIAREFQRGSEPLADLVQVAAIGLVKAADRFDPDYGTAFTSFASVTIRGELRRHYRDHGWTVRVPRSLQERRAHTRHASETMTARLGRSPTVAELAEYLRVSSDDIIEALYADENYRPLSLESRVGDGFTLGDQVASDESGYDSVDADDAFTRLTDGCPERLEAILRMRYVDGLTQREIADQVGVSQVHISRLLARAHLVLRTDRRAESAPARATWNRPVLEGSLDPAD